MTDLRYVVTDDIKKAVAGRETDVLDALDIDWRAGRPHIRCPYWDHADNDPSWRWDERRAHAICTCTINGHADGILDVVGKVQRLEFEQAKVRAAELLHRDDLIRTRSEGGNGQKQDANSLLNAKAASRDDRLPFIYLAARLAITEDDVPHPSTRVVGLKSLGYYDPPAKKGGKPILAGEWPCAVFGTVAADGRTHAHRIFLAADGRGKADLGIGPNKKPRNPKKSAKIIGDDNTAGCAVIWGDPHTATHIVVFEGIETAVAGAAALKDEIYAGAIAVASAITAGGIEAFQPYPATRRVTIGADRDDLTKESKPGHRRGEIAARAFGLKHYEQIEVAVGLPGNPGEHVDWLGIFLRDGKDPVRKGILDASAFIPTEEEIAAAESAKGQVSELQAINRSYPLPQRLNSLKLEYRFAKSGEIMVHRERESPETGRKQWIPIASPFGITARLRYASENAYGLRCVVQSMDGRPSVIDFDRRGLPKLGASDIRAMLFEAGLRTEGDGEQVAVQVLKAANPEREILTVRRPGWHEMPGHPASFFVTPKGAVIAGPGDIELVAAARLTPDVAEAGTLEDWRRAVTAAALVSGCPHWVLGIVAGFVGPIVSLTGLDTCGINFSGLSSSGKSIAQQLAASAWSTPDIRRAGLNRSARTTDNAIEPMAQRATGTVLSLDELAHASGKNLGKMIYTIAGGVGKTRMNADASLRDTYTWSTFAVLSCECSLQEKVCSDGGEWLAGMAVRIVDIDVTGIDREVDPETLHSIGGIEHHYGHAGPAFVQALIEHSIHNQAPALRDRVLNGARGLAGKDNSDSAIIRAAMPLSLLLIAGTFAKTFGLLPTDTPVTEAVQWAWSRFTKSAEAAPLDPETQIINHLRSWIAERWAVTIKSIDAESGINNRETVAWFDDTAIYIPKDRLREAAGNSLRESQVAAILERRGMIARKTETDRLYVRFIPKVGRVASYALSRAEFGREVRDPNVFTVHRGGRDD